MRLLTFWFDKSTKIKVENYPLILMENKYISLYFHSEFWKSLYWRMHISNENKNFIFNIHILGFWFSYVNFNYKPRKK